MYLPTDYGITNKVLGNLGAMKALGVAMMVPIRSLHQVCDPQAKKGVMRAACSSMESGLVSAESLHSAGHNESAARSSSASANLQPGSGLRPLRGLQKRAAARSGDPDSGLVRRPALDERLLDLTNRSGGDRLGPAEDGEALRGVEGAPDGPPRRRKEQTCQGTVVRAAGANGASGSRWKSRGAERGSKQRAEVP
ncbi:hypothetical protein NDU88_002502 [Pleurodeles waltl]|uniref:Uncharacterized protein n=1 Tax=Pleurodeles waltl TaxID=8319 RepID=A0AAV7VZJ0_PLEWA|nr:hypothetical protein NDU88_002502 [Pleurodeles waltl]